MFISATFNELTIFSSAIFIGHALFKDSTFIGDAFFEETTFIGDAFFEEATIGSRLVLRNLNPAESSTWPFHCHFKHIKFQFQGGLRFQDLSLAKCEFAGTDLRRPEFHHVDWHLLWGGRQAIYDEVLLRQKELSLVKRLLNFIGLMNATDAPTTDDYGQVERLYRNLKMNYIGEGDNKNAGDFHYGEMEMHRRASKWRWFPFYWNNLYRVLSGYGERPSWALGWLAGFLAGMAGVVWGLGLEVGNPPHLADFGESFIYVLQKATLQRPTWAEPMGFGGKLVAGFSVLLIPGQAALFLLALRNRLGRRR